jgi:hypothetical protein
LFRRSRSEGARSRKKGQKLESTPKLISKNIIRRNYKNEKLSTSWRRPSVLKKKQRPNGARMQNRASKNSFERSSRRRRRSTCRPSRSSSRRAIG